MKKIFKNDNSLGNYVADQIEELIKNKNNALISIAAGTSCLPVFDELIKRVAKKQISFSQSIFVALDEWIDFSINDDGSMGNFLTKHFLKHVDFSKVFLFNGMNPEFKEESKKAEDFIESHGGIDYIVLGLGMNGHIALNEPGTMPEERTRFVKVDSITADVGKKYFEDDSVVLTGGITLGIANILEADKAVLLANSSNKREIVEKFVKSKPSSALPATYLKEKKNFEFLITEDVLGK